MLLQKIRSFLFILFCMALLMGPLTQSRAGDTAADKAGVETTQHAKAQIPASLIAKWKKQAEQGNATAQFLLGNAYYNGNGVPQDYNEAINWWQQAADQGNMSAKKSLEQLVPK